MSNSLFRKIWVKKFASYQTEINYKDVYNKWGGTIKYRNCKPEPSVICQYVCQWILFVQPIRSLIQLSVLVLYLYMKITTCLLVLINQSRAESCEFVSSLSAHDSSQREIQKTGISYMITMGWTHLLILSCVTQLPSIWCSCWFIEEVAKFNCFVWFWLANEDQLWWRVEQSFCLADFSF